MELTGLELSDSFLSGYAGHLTYDEMFTKDRRIRDHWKALLKNIAGIGLADFKERQNEIQWHLSENGVTYNVYDDPTGLNRPWNLNAVPLLVTQDEWKNIEKGLEQRAELFNLIYKDIYGKRRLIKSGILPMELIYSHSGFLRQCHGLVQKDDGKLTFYAADIARGPDGRMWVISDRMQAPSGMGYAFENRLTMGRVLPEIFEEMGVVRLSSFFARYRQSLAKLCPYNKENPNIALLTPGPHNETYFEHTYLASFLGFTLVQGGDLVVKNGKVWLKSLKGLRRVDIIVRRVDETFCDPLELNEDSHLGVPGLLEAIRQRNVVIVNPLGVGVLENPGLTAFLPAISKYFLNEELLLPSIASWWCGQDKERGYVLDNLSKLIIKRIDRTHQPDSIFGNTLTEAQKDQLALQIKAQPHQFVGQELVSFSSIPTYINSSLEPRYSAWRTFAMAGQQDYFVMPGGLVRTAPEKGKLMVSSQTGGISKDVWILTNGKETQAEPFVQTESSTYINQGLEQLPSRTAESLYWVGRYATRALYTARMVRMVVRHIYDSDRFQTQSHKEAQETLLRTLTHFTMTYPGFVGKGSDKRLASPEDEVNSVILDPKRIGSLTQTIDMLTGANYSVPNLWSADSWRVFDRVDKKWKEMITQGDINFRSLVHGLDTLITRLIAFIGLSEESISEDQGLLLFNIGRRFEHSMLIISKVRSMLYTVHKPQAEYSLLEALLTSNESLNIYRYRYRSFLRVKSVLDLVFFDSNYPRSLVYQLQDLTRLLEKLPREQEDNQLSEEEKAVLQAYTLLRLSNSQHLTEQDKDSTLRENLEDLASEMTNLLINASNIVSKKFFTHAQEHQSTIKRSYTV